MRRQAANESVRVVAMQNRSVPTQKWRALYLLIYLVMLVGLSRYLFGEWMPPASGGKAVWFYGGLASLLLGNYLVTPYFSKPVDAISYSVAASAALIGAEDLLHWNAQETFSFYLVMVHCGIIALVSFVAIFFRDSERDILKKIGQTSAVFASTFGSHRAIFGLLILVAAFLFHRSSAKEVFLISLACLFFVVARPDEVVNAFFENLRRIWKGAFAPATFGIVAAMQTPHIYLIRLSVKRTPKFGSLIAVRVYGGLPLVAVTLDEVGRDESKLLRCIDCAAFGSAAIQVSSALQEMPDESASLIGSDVAGPELVTVSTLCTARLLGLVAVETSNERLYFEVVTTQVIEQGLLVQVLIQGNPVVYQILDGLTKEEIVYQKNTFGTVRAQAKKIGQWSSEDQKFLPSKWLPSLNEPVLLAENPAIKAEGHPVGCFPGGSYPVYLKDIDRLVTHNTAILGILGVGKSMLAIELVERMLARGIKVICLDLTDQYADEMSAYYEKSKESLKLDRLYAAGASGRTNYQTTREEGGSVQGMKILLEKGIKAFLESDSQKLKILNPAKFEVWKQEGQMFKPTDIPGMAQLTACQITQLISEATLHCAQELGPIDAARVCLVYEEAHSLVPEWNSVAFDGDKATTAGTSRAILQGRKYGMGCLLITQRTANVTKTILNQCNTIFAMRTFDDTGKEFLSNYVGRDYADTLSGLPERHAVFFGRASSCENPVLIQLNNRDRFREGFRAEFPPPFSLPTSAAAIILPMSATDGLD